MAVTFKFLGQEIPIYEPLRNAVIALQSEVESDIEILEDKLRLRNSLERMVQRLGLQDRVVFAGHVTSIEKIWVENHVLVMPSRFEGMPLAIVEAMLCARAVVATDVAGHSEIIDDGVTGFLADAPTVSSMANALERLWAGRMSLEAMGKAAAKSIREHVPADPIRVFSEKMKSLAGA